MMFRDGGPLQGLGDGSGVRGWGHGDRLTNDSAFRAVENKRYCVVWGLLGTRQSVGRCESNASSQGTLRHKLPRREDTHATMRVAG